jgi:hypothetical protein
VGDQAGDQAGLLVLLILRGVDMENMVLALQALSVGQQDETFGFVVEFVGGLLDDGEMLIDAVEGLVAELIGLLDVGRGVLVGLMNAVLDDGVVQEVLERG